MKASFNLNIDDIHPGSSKDYGDCGGDMDDGVFRYLNLLVDEFPELKTTLFTTPDWRYKQSPGRIRRQFDFLLGSGVKLWEEKKFLLTNHPEWCEWLREKVKTGNFEIGVHGLHHYQTTYPYGAEFANLSYEECAKRIKRAEEIFKQAKIPFVKVFRPPGWGINENLLKALSELEYAIAGSADHKTEITKNAVCNETGLRASIIYPQKIERRNLVNIPQNWDPTRNDVERAKEIVRLGGLVSAKVHICRNYGKEIVYNGLDEEMYTKLKRLFIEISASDVCFINLKQAIKA